MSTSPNSTTDRSQRTGAISAVLGLIGVAAFIWLWVLTATPLDPENWIRILGLVFLPIGVGGAVIAGIAGLRGSGRRYALVGLVAAAAAVIAFIVLINIYG